MRLQLAAIATVMAPPPTTAGTLPTRKAVSPDSNAPSWLEALMNTISTAATRPRRRSGVASATVVERMFMLNRSTKPLTPRATSDST
jgi:hypothetical protein